MLSSGAVVADGTIGCLIPPSGMFIIYGIRTETLIGALMIAGFRRRLDRPALTRAAYDTLRTPGFIFGNLVGTLVFNALVTVTTVPLNILGWVTEMALPPFAALHVALPFDVPALVLWLLSL